MSNSSDQQPLKARMSQSSDRDLSSHSVEQLIQQLQQRSEELEEANRELRRISNYRSLFLARMSHELRTPLTSILGFSEILLDHEQLSDVQRRFCQRIQDSGMQLQASLNQLVDLSRLEAGQTELFVQEFSLREMLRELCAAAARAAQKREVTLEYDLVPEISTIVSDQGKLRQVLYSFLLWSISHGPIGSAVKIFAELPRPLLLRITIDDQGEPISDTSKIFDPDGGVANEADLNDLGIIIGRRLLETMGGSVQLENCLPSGRRTTVEISARPPQSS